MPTTRRPIAVLDAPSNLGLRPPEPGSIPGCYKLPWALRDRSLLGAIRAQDAGVLVPPRYRAEWTSGEGDRNAEAIARFSIRLADRLGGILQSNVLPLVLGGDCSILVGNALALKRAGRYRLVFVDAHSDFRHPGNAPSIGAAAGEDLAIVTGRGDLRLVNLEGRGPYIRDEDVILVGVRAGDDYLHEVRSLGMSIITSALLAQSGVEHSAGEILDKVRQAAQGFWIHLDLDVVDKSEMPAVDSPEPDGLSFSMLTALLRLLLASPACAGMEVTIFDPDLDPDGSYADQVAACLREAFSSQSAGVMAD